MKKVLLFLSIVLSACTTLPPVSPEPIPSETPTPVLTPSVIPAASLNIDAIIANSKCIAVRWQDDRGKAPLAAVKGIAETFVKSVCANRPLMTKPVTNKLTDKKATDVFAFYPKYEPTLPNLYTLLLSASMSESSGKYCEGYDTSAATHTSTNAEAGILQQSYDLMANAALKDIYNEYKAHPEKCGLDTFKQGVSCKSQSIVGSGPGAEFQKFIKSCPALAVEQAGLGFRLAVRHWGPARRAELVMNSDCQQMFKDIEKTVVCK